MSDIASYPGGPSATAAAPAGGTVGLFRAALRLTSSLKVPEALNRLVDSACALTGAAWGTIAVPGPADPATAASLTTGTATASADELATMLAGAPGAGPEDSGVLVRNMPAGDAQDCGTTILSAPLRSHGRIYGRLYLCDKRSGFTDADVTAVLTLAEAAAVALENARLYREARDREQWMAVSQELTTMLLSGADEGDALTLIARRVREVAHADTAALVLPSVGETWICEIADGKHADQLIGTFFPPAGRALKTLARRTGLIEDSLADAWGASDLLVEELARFGPALYAPMVHRGRGVGVMLLLREQGAERFTRQDLEIAELVAGQATMAFELADAQHAEEMATLLDERARIGRDLHDLAIQQLFATGMQLSAARDRLEHEGAASGTDMSVACRALDASLAAVDDSVRQIRSIVRSLRDRDEDVSVVERLRREASLARTSLGFAPSLILTVDGHGLAQAERDREDELIAMIDAAVEPDLADDIVAVVREGLSNVARHAKASSVTVDVKVEGLLGSQPPAGQDGAASGDAEPFQGAPVVEVVCRDDGVGVDPRVTRRSGTANMAERARRHAGSFVIGPRARSDGERRGTCFTWRVPLERDGRSGLPDYMLSGVTGQPSAPPS
ncbi:GAF domain-containing sensor histidine kinase [Actinomyces qiguomingii]|uniref:GAF domain-containing sensor histidine kinase n=1 Tax=Actinomyces qiguomingii TaxID=2057800 RepID=UPI000CA07ED6|nr:GAF domain-containing protein [Actinomyces qiguomingii]